MVDDRDQDQRLTRRNGAARAAHDRARRQARTEQREWRTLVRIEPSARGAFCAKLLAALGVPRLLAIVPLLAICTLGILRGREALPQPLFEILAIVFAHGVVADRARYRGHARFKRRAPLRRIKGTGFGLARPQ